MNTKQDNGLTAEATWFDKVWNAAEVLSKSAGVKVWSILNSNTTFGSAGGAGVVAVGGAQWVETTFISFRFIDVVITVHKQTVHIEKQHDYKFLTKKA